MPAALAAQLLTQLDHLSVEARWNGSAALGAGLPGDPDCYVAVGGGLHESRYGPGLESAQSFAYVLFEDDHGGVVVGRVRLRRGWFGGALVVGDHAEDLDECGYGRIVVGEVAHHSDRAQEVAQTCFSGRC